MLRSVIYLYILNKGGWQVKCPFCNEWHNYAGEEVMYCTETNLPFECLNRPKTKS